MRGDLEFMSVPRLVRTAAERYGEREAVVDGRTRISYRQLGAQVERAAAACLAAGVRTGDRVAVWAPNSLGWIVCALGAVTAGAVLVPVNTRLKGAEAAQLLARTRARLLFVTGPFLGTSYVAALRQALARRDGRTGRFATRSADGQQGLPSGPLPGLPHLRDVVVLADEAPGGSRTWKEFLAAGGSVSAGAVRLRANGIGPGAPSDIMFTSGTTGLPKGVVVTQAQTLRAFATWADLAGLGEEDRYLIVNPFSHTFGYKAGVLACLMRGATMVPQPVFEPGALLATLAAERITVLPGPPALYRSLLDHPGGADRGLSALRLAVTGAASVDGRLVERIRTELGIATVLTAYGMSEATGLVTMCRRDDPPEVAAHSCGRAVPGTEVVVVDAAGAFLPPGGTGEILVRGHQVMAGYFENPSATARAVDPQGWLHTGDVGVLDADGNLRITDRLTDMYVVGGFNVCPAEVERLLARHPGLADVAVVGVPDARLGEVGKAFAVRRPGSRSPSAGELLAWARREMAGYKVPREVEFVPELPRNAAGKVLKRRLRQGVERAGGEAGSGGVGR
ncbi:AMP-binding protein [Streptomyces gamaensis]|uniref:AMP-binding protein n=1 Tax=Streptomyces gamaensis TaxID=1763542 RepID=A0ABW0Z1Y1_9ACTN